MAFCGKKLVRSKKGFQNGYIFKQASYFNSLVSDESYNRDRHFEIKLHKYKPVCDTINKTFENKIRIATRKEFYRIMAASLLLSCSKSWILRKLFGNYSNNYVCNQSMHWAHSCLILFSQSHWHVCLVCVSFHCLSNICMVSVHV